ncbi:uncharacterized protein LOC117172036 [Belonocnema kinseyi]|uniref:uncharacterized protein LOC117172036 n=1 Tax=Belonocnema kinseyi TaxID=2817044 RepID=UPI00143DB83A|nr:uncharacterized protein LOC117172036 [Belonocnema kinseyi]
MHLGNIITLVSFSVALSSNLEADHEVQEKKSESSAPRPVNQPKDQKMSQNDFSLKNNSEEIIKRTNFISYFNPYSKYGSKLNPQREKKRRKTGKSIKEERDGRQIKIDAGNLPDVSQLYDEIIGKIRKLLESEIKEINSMSEQRSSTNQAEKESILFDSTLRPFHSTSKPFDLVGKIETMEAEKEKYEPSVNFNKTEIIEETNNQVYKRYETISQEETENIEKVSIEIVPDNHVKKGRPLEASLDEKTQHGHVSMMKLSRNGGIENHLSRKEIGSPTWRSELSDNKQQTQNVKSSESIVYFKISSSSQEPESNVTKLVQGSEKLPTLVALVKQSSEASRIHLNDEKAKKEKKPIEKIQSRTKEESIEPREEDLLEAANFGMQAMNDLYYIKEPKLYSLGLFLSTNNPARYVANFNDQSDEARHLAKFGYAALEGTKLFISKYPEISRENSIVQFTTRSALHRQCPRRGIPQCPPASLRYRTADGSCNNPQKLWWGSAMSTMQRFLPPVYQDGVQSVRRSVSGDLLPSAREVSNLIHEDRDIPLASVSHMLMQWGQFVDHDITATGQSRGFNGTVPQCCLDRGAGFQSPEFMHPDCLPIAVSPRDTFFSRLGVRCLEFMRSGPAPREDCEFGPREQVSQVTSYLDASTVYSSNAVHSDSLRIFRDGLLQYGKLQSLRHSHFRDESDICQLGSLSQSCFKAGDGRLGENPALTSLHVVFLRLHNRITAQFPTLNPHWSDEKMFQETRKIVGAIVQHITYREFLPIVLGPDVMKIFELDVLRKGYFEGYDPTVNPNMANEFAAAAYRFGHSLVQRSFMRFDRNHRPLLNNVSIHEEFFNPHVQSAGSLDRIILGLVNQPSQKRDEFISEELTNHLFQSPSFPFGMDLASINIQRGRDHGLPPYTHWRVPCGLSPINNWDDLERVMRLSTARKFRRIYSAVDDIDLFPAGLAEIPVVGGLVGPTFACIIAQQFSNLKKGDRFWFENPNKENRFTPQQLQMIRSTTLAQILCRTMDNIESVQPFVMLLPDNFKNQRISCNNPRFRSIDIQTWAEVPPKKANKTRENGDSLNNRESVSRSDNRKKTELNQRQSMRPTNPNINQQNRIVLKRPIGNQENITIVVKNYAVNSPVFVNDAIYGSHLQLNPQTTNKHSTLKPSEFFEDENVQESPSYPIQKPAKPKPVNPSGGYNPYIPQSFEDSSNPNPPSYGFSPSPANNYVPNNAFFDTLYNNNYKPNGERPNYNLESGVKPISEIPEDNPDNFPQNSWAVRPSSNSEGYPTRPTSGSNQHFYNSKRPDNVQPIDQNVPNYNRPFSHKPSDQDNPNHPVDVESYQPVISNVPSYQRPVSIKPTTQRSTKIPSSSYKRPTQRPESDYKNRPTTKPESPRPQYWSEDDSALDSYSDINYKVFNSDSAHSKSVTLPSFTVASESLETVRFREQVKTTPKRKSVSELPRPLIPQHRIEDDSLGERAEIAGPGLHYFNKNVLYKYPQKRENLTNFRHENYRYHTLNTNDSSVLSNSKHAPEKELKLSSFVDSKYREENLNNDSVVVEYTIDPEIQALVIKDEIKLTTTPTTVVADNNSSQLESSKKSQDEPKYYEDTETEAVIVDSIADEITVSLIIPDALIPSTDSFPNLTLSMEQPELNVEFPSSEELPKPFKLRAPTS